MTDPDTVAAAFNAWWPRHAVRHNSRSPAAAREAFDAGFEAGRAEERQRIKQRLLTAAAEMGYEPPELWGMAFPHLADFLHDLLDGDGDGTVAR